MIPSPLDRTSVVPLYYQIRQRFLGQIRSGSLKAGELLPSEHVIATRFRVSRMTVRQALKSLCELGVANTQIGKGTFVTGVKLEKSFRRVLSFSEEMQERGARPGARTLAFAVVRPDRETSEALQLSRGEKVVSLRRIRLANSLAMGIERSCLPLRLCPDLLKTFDTGTSLYKALAGHYGIEMAVADEVVEAGPANTEEARLLGISPGSTVFYLTRTSFIQSGQPVEFVKSVYRADRYKIVNRLTRVNRELLPMTRVS
jgi:GntR family transcriptional regulator